MNDRRHRNVTPSVLLKNGGIRILYVCLQIEKSFIHRMTFRIVPASVMLYRLDIYILNETSIAF